MTKYEMRVQSKYFNLLKNGKKTIELRLLDEKRQMIAVGDVIKFMESENLSDSFEAKVVALHLAENFEKLGAKIDFRQAGFDTLQNMIEIMKVFYPLDSQQKYGVVGIEIQRI